MMGWIDEVRQEAIINEAEAVAKRHLRESYAPVLAKYMLIGFDMKKCATELLEMSGIARQARVDSSAAQAAYEIESGQSRDEVEEAKKYLRQLRAVIRYARANGHPLDAKLDRLFVDDLSAESWSDSVDSLSKALGRFTDSTKLTGKLVADLTKYGLPPDFVERGQQLYARLHVEREEADEAGSVRPFFVNELHETLERIVATFERMDAARDLVMALTGEELPGLELTLVRGAAASRGTAEPAPPVPAKSDDAPEEPGL